jgi:hypothetical protein
MATSVPSISATTNPDRMHESEIRKRIKWGDFLLIENTNKTISSIWSNLRLIAHADNLANVLEGWVACQYCENVFRTHSKLKSDGTRKNYGLTSPARHLDLCKNRKRELLTQTDHSAANQTQHPESSSSFKSIARSFFNKRQLPAKTLAKLKDAQLKYVVAGTVTKKCFT